MKSKALLIAAFLAIALLVSAVVSAQELPARYLIKSNNDILKSKFDVMHEFNSGFTADLTSSQIAELKKKGIEVEKVGQYKILGTLSPIQPKKCSPSERVPWGVKMLNGGSGGKGVVVAVLDTGVNKNHPDLKANIKLCVDATKRKITSGCTDTVGHGTHVIGTIAANGGNGKGIYGVAPEASILAIKVCNSQGCSMDSIAEGIRYAADNGANIISMSLGSIFDFSLIKEAVDYAVSKGVLVIAAAGNEGPYEDTICYPAAYENVVAVAAIDKNKNIAYFSSRGLNDGDYIIEDREIEVSAPGVDVESTSRTGCYATYRGTSMATPHISGLAAKLWQGDAASTREYLQSLAKLHDIGMRGDDIQAGFGLPISP